MLCYGYLFMYTFPSIQKKLKKPYINEREKGSNLRYIFMNSKLEYLYLGTYLPNIILLDNIFVFESFRIFLWMNPKKSYIFLFCFLCKYKIGRAKQKTALLAVYLYKSYKNEDEILNEGGGGTFIIF